MRIKYSFLINLLSLIVALKDKRWLDKNGYIYYLDFWSIFKNESVRVDNIKKMLEDIDSENRSKVVYLQKYGTYGSYKLPNKIYINIYQPLDKVKDTFYHELKHLQVEKFVQKHKLAHQQKEDMVNKMIVKSHEDKDDRK